MTTGMVETFWGCVTERLYKCLTLYSSGWYIGPFNPLFWRSPENGASAPRHVAVSENLYGVCRSPWPRGLRRRSAAKRLLGSWVRIEPGAWMFVCCTVFVLSSRGLCDGPIPRLEESYWVWCVSECDQVKINNLDTCCEQVEEGRTAIYSLYSCCVYLLANMVHCFSVQLRTAELPSR
jgi:hypothetical protein